MARWYSSPVQLTAQHVAGTQPILSATPNGAIARKLLSLQSRSAGAIELGFDAAPAAGQGVPVAANARIDFDPMAPDFNGDLFILGGTPGEYIVLVIS